MSSLFAYFQIHQDSQFHGNELRGISINPYDHTSNFLKPKNLISPHLRQFLVNAPRTVYQRTYDDLKINPCEHVLAPLSIYLDELKMDAFGKMGLEPVVLTILIYNRATRNHHSAHRVIGYMPNFHMIFKSKGYSADDKANDYHQCLKVIHSRKKHPKFAVFSLQKTLKNSQYRH